MIIIRIKKAKTETTFFNRIDRLPTGRWGSLGGSTVQSEEEYRNPEGQLVMSFKKLPDSLLDWAEGHKNIEVSKTSPGQTPGLQKDEKIIGTKVIIKATGQKGNIRSYNGTEYFISIPGIIGAIGKTKNEIAINE